MFLYWLRGPEGSWKNRGCCQISRPPDMHEGSPTVKPGQPPGSKLHVSKMLLVFFFFQEKAFFFHLVHLGTGMTGNKNIY